jgi:hypothetical protein
MPAWPRTIIPTKVGAFQMPGALQAWSLSGKGQLRATMAAGRMWTEVYPTFCIDDAGARGFLAFIQQMWRNGQSFTIDHRAYLTPKGGGTGSPTVQGAQTGSSLVTQSWTGSNPVLKDGDIIRIGSMAYPYVLDVIGDAPNLSGGVTTLTVSPPLFVGNPAPNAAAITYTGVLLTACLVSPPNIPPIEPGGFLSGLQLTFREFF